MNTLSFSYVLFAAVFGLFSFAALYARNVGPVFGLTFERLANPVFSFGAMLAVLIVANAFVPPLLLTASILIAIAALCIAMKFVMFRRKETKYIDMMDTIVNIFLGTAGIMLFTNLPPLGFVGSTLIPTMIVILTAITIAMSSLRQQKQPNAA